MEPVTPLRHLGGMESMMSVVTVVVAAGAAVTLIAAGVFSVASLLWGDLLESEQDGETSSVDLSTAA